MFDDRPYLVLRKHRGNRFTLPVLLGCMEQEGLTADFRVLLANSKEQIAEKIREGKALIGYSFMTPNLEGVREEVKWLRGNLSGGPIFIAGGSHATGDPQGTLALGFDFVFAGEAEETFPGFLYHFLAGKNSPGKILEGDNRTNHPLVHPPHSLEHRFFAPIEITRGCLYGCTYCQTPRIFGHRLRHRPPENTQFYLQQAIPHGFLQTKFISPNAFSYGSKGRCGPSLERMEELLAACRGAGIEGIHFGCFPSEVRPDWVTPEVLELVKKHCRNRTIVLGAQTGSDSLLEKLKRGHTAEQALNAARCIRQAEFMPHVDFVFGFPGETMEDRKVTLQMIDRLIQELGAKIHAHTYMPLPGTPLFQENPSALDPSTKEILLDWEKKKRLDGWWKEQEIIAWKIVEWRDRGIIQGRD